MTQVSIDYRDGNFSLERHDPPWPDAIDIPDSLWAAYELHRQECRAWYHVIRALDKQLYEDRATNEGR